MAAVKARRRNAPPNDRYHDRVYDELSAHERDVYDRIARGNLGIYAGLRARGRDSLDFYDMHVTGILKALRLAYWDGFRDGQGHEADAPRTRRR